MKTNVLLNGNLKLKLVQVLFRHGARTPVAEELSVYNYLNNFIYELWGIGALTNVGKKQAYELGTFLRERYEKFLSPNYKSTDVYAHSTDSERTKMSLQLVLAGLYPPKDYTIWNPDLQWSPVPCIYTPHKFDILLRPYDRPQYRRLMRETYTSDEFIKRFKSYSEFLKYVSDKTEVKFDHISKVACTFGTLISNENMNLKMPEWYTTIVKQNFISIMNNIYYDGYAFTPEMKRFGPGFIIKTFIDNMNLNETTFNPRQIYLYSAHDDNLATFIRAHDIRQFRFPPYGSSLIFEKLTDTGNSVYVRLLAWTRKGQVETLKIGNHEEFCPIEDYLKIVDSIIPSDNQINDMLTDTVTPAEMKNVIFNDPVVNKL